MGRDLRTILTRPGHGEIAVAFFSWERDPKEMARYVRIKVEDRFRKSGAPEGPFSLKRILLGNPLATSQTGHQSISKTVALAVFSSDALSSVAYATEEILLALSAGGILALRYGLPVAGLVALKTGKYAINPHCYQSEIVPVSIITLNWATAATQAHEWDTKLQPIEAKSREGFVFKIDLQVQIHVAAAEAPRRRRLGRPILGEDQR